MSKNPTRWKLKDFKEDFNHMSANAGPSATFNCFIGKNEEYMNYLENKLKQMGQSSSDLKANFMGEHYDLEEQIIHHDNGNESDIMVKRFVSWDLQKTIFKEMCEYVKNRKDEDYRP